MIVLKSPKGICLQLQSGKVIAIRASGQKPGLGNLNLPKPGELPAPRLPPRQDGDVIDISNDDDEESGNQNQSEDPLTKQVDAALDIVKPDQPKPDNMYKENKYRPNLLPRKPRTLSTTAAPPIASAVAQSTPNHLHNSRSDSKFQPTVQQSRWESPSPSNYSNNSTYQRNGNANNSSQYRPPNRKLANSPYRNLLNFFFLLSKQQLKITKIRTTLHHNKATLLLFSLHLHSYHNIRHLQLHLHLTFIIRDPHIKILTIIILLAAVQDIITLIRTIILLQIHLIILHINLQHQMHTILIIHLINNLTTAILHLQHIIQPMTQLHLLRILTQAHRTLASGILMHDRGKRKKKKKKTQRKSKKNCSQIFIPMRKSLKLNLN